MKVVFVVHYFPPQASVGHRRIIEFCKTLYDQGVDISVITTRKSQFIDQHSDVVPSYIDLNEVSLRSNPSKCKNTVLQEPADLKNRVSIIRFLRRVKWIINRLFGSIFDSRLLFVLAVMLLRKKRRITNVMKDADILISSAPPWPVHLAARILAKTFHKPWIVDYRDQFSNNHFIKPPFFIRKIETLIDRKMIEAADRVVVVSKPMKEYYDNFHKKVCVIQNGYPADIFSMVRMRMAALNPCEKKPLFLIRYMGSVCKNRIPVMLINAMASLPEEYKKKIKLEFYGNCHLVQTYIEDNKIRAPIFIHKPVKLEESIAIMLASDLLLIKETSSIADLSSRGVLTTKLFEYMAARKGIIAEVDDQILIARYIKESGLDAIISLDSSKIRDFLINYIKQPVFYQPNDDFINQFSRKEQALKLLSLVNEVLKGATVNV